MNADRYPLDFDAYNRGDVIPPDVVRQAIENEPGFREMDYGLYQMRLGSMLSEHLSIKHGAKVTVRRCGEGLRVLTDAEQFDRVGQLLQEMGRKARLAVVTSVGIKSTMLDDDRRNKLDRLQQVASFRAQQIMKAPPPRLEG